MTKRISSRSLAPLLAAAALPFTPALAQEISTPTVQAPPAAETPAPAPAAAAPAVTFAAPNPVVQNAPPPGPQPEDLARQAQADAAARQTRRATSEARTSAPARTAAVAAPAATVTRAAAPARESTTPAPAETPTIAAPVADTAAPAADQTTTTTETTTSLNWVWIAVGAVAILAIGALLLFRRRRTEDEVYYDDAVYEEPVAVAPVTAAPVAPLAAMPAHEPEVAAAVASRPQIELGIRPLRAGSDNGQARVDYEVIVENAGALDARGVTVTSWLLNAESSDAESNMIERQVNVAAGDVTTVEGSATVDNTTGAFRPIVAADARYTLPDGSEGHIAARFAVGVDGGEPGRITPIVLDRDELREDLGARLEGEVERA
jgi:hypothetical protein